MMFFVCYGLGCEKDCWEEVCRQKIRELKILLFLTNSQENELEQKQQWDWDFLLSSLQFHDYNFNVLSSQPSSSCSHMKWDFNEPEWIQLKIWGICFVLPEMWSFTMIEVDDS